MNDRHAIRIFEKNQTNWLKPSEGEAVLMIIRVNYFEAFLGLDPLKIP